MTLQRKVEIRRDVTQDGKRVVTEISGTVTGDPGAVHDELTRLHQITNSEKGDEGKASFKVSEGREL